MNSVRTSNITISIFIHSILFLFFFQLLADFVAAIYAFGLMGLCMPPELACVLLLFSPVLLIFFRKGPSRKGLALLAAGVLLSRLAEVWLDTRGKVFVAGLGVAIFLLFLPAYFYHQGREPRSHKLGISLGLGVALSILLRALGSGVDLSNLGMFKAIDWVLALLTGVCLWRTFPAVAGSRSPALPPEPAGGARPVKIIILSLGMAAVFILTYFAFSSPAVIARWTGASYLLILVVLLMGLSAFVIGLVWKPSLFTRIKPGLLLAWNVLFVLCLALTLLANQVSFPSTPEGYPLSQSPFPWQEVPLFLMLLLAPVILADFTLFSNEIITEKPSIRLLGGGFTLGSLFLLVMIFAQVFTTVYDYIPVVGPLFRDKFWIVFLVGGVVVTLPSLFVRKSVSVRTRKDVDVSFPLPLAACMVLITIAAISGVLFTSPRPSKISVSKTTLRVLTYNIQQGYNQDGQIAFDEQLALVRNMNPDVVGLQESDTARIAGGNADIVRYFADRLEMYSYYGPSTVAGTFGIAMLSRYPILNPSTFYMYSVGEQTATITAQIAIGEELFNVFITHLGNDGPIIQQEQVLQLLEGKDNILLMGDFNFRPDTDQYRLTTARLKDTWLLRWPQGISSLEFDSSERIDYLFISPGINVSDSQYLTGTQSDHPALFVDIER